MPAAGILIIGNEILSGKIVDANSPYLCSQLRELGVEVERIVTIPDDRETIAGEVKWMSEAFDLVFTSGGIGPTHDDLTMEGVASAFGRRVVQSESIAARIQRAQGRAPDESQLKMAMIPEGATLVDAGDLWFPAIIVENVFIFPGVPELLRSKFESIRERFRGEPFVLRRVYVRQLESDLVPSLNELLHEFPDLMLGSYPQFRESSHRVMLTLESRDAEYLQRALDSLLARIPAEAIHKVE
ncbi:MAG: molybdopterin-binding protein [Myxococcales bacterium]|nr:molybdopterin-binding protein [Myxococcales bacterium]